MYRPATEAARAQATSRVTWLLTRKNVSVAKRPQANRGMARRKAHWALEQGGVARMEDVGVPRSRVPDLLEALEEVGASHAIRIGVFGHAGDGNLHPCFVMERDDPRAEERVEAARADLFRHVLRLGGTISGEHGTGTVKKGYLEAQRGPDAIRTMRALKTALDPLGILNPGKLLP